MAPAANPLLRTVFAAVAGIVLPCGTAAAEPRPGDDWQGEWVSADGSDGTFGVTIADCTTGGGCRFNIFGVSSMGRNCTRHGTAAGALDSRSLTALLKAWPDESSGGWTFEVTRETGADGEIMRVSRPITSDGSAIHDSCTPLRPGESRVYHRQSRDPYVDRSWTSGCYALLSKAGHAWCTDAALHASLDNAQQIPYVNVDYNWLVDRGIMTRCETADDAKTCLEEAYREKTAQLRAESERVATLYRAPGDSAAGKRILDTIAGVYKRTFQNSTVDGHKYQSEDVLEIVPVSDFAAYVKMHFDFFNGHTCGLAGVVEYKKNGAFVFYDPERNHSCLLTIRLDQGKLTLSDPNGACRQGSCGARGGYEGETFPLSRRRPIRYMPIILQSQEYQAALSAFKQRHPGSP